MLLEAILTGICHGRERHAESIDGSPRSDLGNQGPKPGSLDVLECKQVSRARTIFEDRNIVAIGIAEGGIVLAGWPVLRDLFVYQRLTEDFDARSKHE